MSTSTWFASSSGRRCGLLGRKSMHPAVRAKRFVSVPLSKNHNACFSRIIAGATDAVSPGPQPQPRRTGRRWLRAMPGREKLNKVRLPHHTLAATQRSLSSFCALRLKAASLQPFIPSQTCASGEHIVRLTRYIVISSHIPWGGKACGNSSAGPMHNLNTARGTGQAMECAVFRLAILAAV